MVTGAVGPAIGVLGASYVGCNRSMATVLFTIGMAFMGFCYCSLRVNALDLSPNFSGTIMAFVNGAGCISGMLTPFFTGLLTPNVSQIHSIHTTNIQFESKIINLIYREISKNGGQYFG